MEYKYVKFDEKGHAYIELGNNRIAGVYNPEYLEKLISKWIEEDSQEETRQDSSNQGDLGGG